MKIIWIRNDHYKKIIAAIKEFLPYETGGILLGYTDVRGNLVVTEVVGPGPDAVHQEDYFLPDGTFQQNEINRVFESSEGKTTYLGDWHSHPFKKPYLSSIDLVTLKKIARHKTSGTKEPVFLIIGTDPLEAKCWQLSLISQRPVNLAIRKWSGNF